MQRLMILQLVFYFFCLESSYASDKTPDSFHESPGCPTNSNCSGQIGKIRTKWLNLFKSKTSYRVLEKFRQKNGILVDMWMNKKFDSSQNLIWWDSPCSNHKIENAPRYLQAKGFVSGTKTSKISLRTNKVTTTHSRESGLFLDPIILLDSKSNTSIFWVPSGDVPYAYGKNKIYILREEQGSYYTLSISTKGHWKIEKTIQIAMVPSYKVNCPEKLISKEKALNLSN